MENDYYIEHKQNKQAEKTTETIKTKLEPHMSIIALQCIICAAALVFCLVVKLFFGDFFLEIKDWYTKNIEVDTNITQVLGDDKKASGGPLETGDIAVEADSDFVYPVSGTVSSNYGYRIDPFTNKTAMHNGIDIAAESGSKIKAVLSGEVIAAEQNHTDYGNYILLDHNGIKTLYAHCQSLKVSKGEYVSKGQTIALCGSTGRSTGSHLHFEVRVGEKRIDPTPFLLASKND